MPTEKTSPMVRFKSRLLRPEAGRGGWSFLLLPKSASAKIPTRGQSPVDGTLDGASFTSVLEPDGEGGHWLKVPKKLRETAGVQEGDIVAVEITPAAKDVESAVPADLRKALAVTPKARTTWTGLTPAARRDWIFWITSAKQPETRARRIVNACDMLAGGKRRVCCFDRSGMYSKSLSAPKAAT